MTYPTLEEAKTILDAASGMTILNMAFISLLVILALILTWVVCMANTAILETSMAKRQSAASTVRSIVRLLPILGIVFWLIFFQPLTGSFREDALRIVSMDRVVHGEKFDATTRVTFWSFSSSKDRLSGILAKAKNMKLQQALIGPVRTAQSTNPFEALLVLNAK